jgi:hypothetical protein
MMPIFIKMSTPRFDTIVKPPRCILGVLLAAALLAVTRVCPNDSACMVSVFANLTSADGLEDPTRDDEPSWV